MGSLTSRLLPSLSFPAAKSAAGYRAGRCRAALRNLLWRREKRLRGQRSTRGIPTYQRGCRGRREKGERSRGAAFTPPFSHPFRFIATFSGETCSRCFNDDGLGNAVGVPSTEVRARGSECWLKMCHGGGGPAVLTAPPRCRIGLSGAAPPCRNSPRRPETRTDCFSCSAPYRRRHRRRAGTALHYDLATRGFRRVLDDGVGPNGLSARSRRVVPTTATPRRSIWRDGWSC